MMHLRVFYRRVIFRISRGVGSVVVVLSEECRAAPPGAFMGLNVEARKKCIKFITNLNNYKVCPIPIFIQGFGFQICKFNYCVCVNKVLRF